MPLRGDTLRNGSEEMPILVKETGRERLGGGGEEKNQELPATTDVSQLTRATSTIVTDSGDDSCEMSGSKSKNTWIDPDPPPYQFWGDSMPEYPSLSPSYQHNTPSKTRRVSAAISAQPIIIQHKIIVCDKLEDLGRERSLVHCINCEQVVRSVIKSHSSASTILLSLFFCFIPLLCCEEKWKEVHHYCPNCDNLITKIKP